jgi:hypothetical protein
MRLVPATPSRAAAILREWLVATGFVVSALWVAQALAAEPSTTTPTAEQLMHTAHEGRAVWEKFPGFQAKLTASTNGKATQGTVTVAADGALRLDLASKEGFDWIDRTFDSLIGHRLADGGAIRNVEFADDDVQHPLGRLIRSHEAGDKSLWRVRGDVLTEVHRFGEKSHFVISVADVTRTPEGKHLPQDFTVTTWDKATEQLLSSRQVHTDWKRVDGVDVPTVWWAAINGANGSRTAQRLELSEHKLLTTPTKTAAVK